MALRPRKRSTSDKSINGACGRIKGLELSRTTRAMLMGHNALLEYRLASPACTLSILLVADISLIPFA